MRDREREIIKLWGTPASYHNFLKEFLEKHDKAHLTTYDTEGCLVSVTYIFAPYQVWLDNERLMEANRKAVMEADEEWME